MISRMLIGNVRVHVYTTDGWGKREQIIQTQTDSFEMFVLFHRELEMLTPKLFILLCALFQDKEVYKEEFYFGLSEYTRMKYR